MRGDEHKLSEPASMRPSAFTDGNRHWATTSSTCVSMASMRPSAFTDGNLDNPRMEDPDKARRFNEAVGFHRRKHRAPGCCNRRTGYASMRPSAFTDGNTESHGDHNNIRGNMLQ